MIFEIADLEIQPGGEGGFEDGVRRARGVLARATGFRSLALQRSIENPHRYLLVIGWDTVENHTVDFRGSPAYQEWRALVGSYIARASVEHVEEINLG